MRSRKFLRPFWGLADLSFNKGRVQAVAGHSPVSSLDHAPPWVQYPIIRESLASNDEALQLARRADDGIYHAVKRVMDIVISIIGLAVFLVLLPVIALLIKIDSRGPVFFSQERIGINRRRARWPQRKATDQRKVICPGRPFRIFKLRTMHVDAEIDGPQWAVQYDARVTRIGRILRKTRLDEVPQFYNVLRGDMSVIGPRPERLCFIRQFENEVSGYHDRLLVLPGITGYAQVRHGYDDGLESVRRKIKLDRQYIGKLGLWVDLRILISTVKVVLTGEGAF